MFCPRCGHEDDAASGPCSSCGLALEPVRKLLAEGPPAKTAVQSEYRAALKAGGLVAVGVVLVILWIIFFAVGEVSGEAFLPFLFVLTWLAGVILFVHLAVAWKRRRRGSGEPAEAA